MIYFIKCGEFVKIGRSNDPNRRLDELKAANPYDLKIIGVVDGGDAEEQRLQAAFESYHHKYEWFFLSKAINSFVDKHCIKPSMPRTSPKDEKVDGKPGIVPDSGSALILKKMTLVQMEEVRRTIGDWFAEKLEACPGHEMRVGLVYEHYLNYCKAKGKASATLVKFGKTMRQLGVKRKGMDKRVYYLDIALKRDLKLVAVANE
jgi:hypothetical protein